MDLVTTIDCQYAGPRHTAAYLLTAGRQAAFIENNTQFAVPLLLRALDEQGLAPDQVAYIIITHVHLDHAGGTAALADACPNAMVLAHPRAVRHMVDPARLVAGARAVYGERRFAALYGDILPVPENRVLAVEDNEQYMLGDRALTFLHTRGHANHHMCIHDSLSGGVFTGDMFGIGYDAARAGSRPYLRFSSAPTDFDPVEARAGIARILALPPTRLYLTHFGELADVQAAAEVLCDSLDGLERILNDAVTMGLSGEGLVAWCEERVAEEARRLAVLCGIDVEAEWSRFAPSLRIDAQGIACAAERRMNASVA